MRNLNLKLSFYDTKRHSPKSGEYEKTAFQPSRFYILPTNQMESDDLQDIVWTPLLERYFTSTGEKCQSYAYLHKRAEEHYSRLSVYIDLPCIILATINGATSIGSSSLFGDNEYASVGVGAVALFTALLQTIGTYFGWSRRAENHKNSSISYAKLYRFLKIEMALPRESRMRPKDLLKSIKTEYDRLAEVSALIPPPIIKAYNKRFDNDKYKEVAKPEESNGLETIVVYNPQKDKEKTSTPPLSADLQIRIPEPTH